MTQLQLMWNSKRAIDAAKKTQKKKYSYGSLWCYKIEKLREIHNFKDHRECIQVRGPRREDRTITDLE